MVFLELSQEKSRNSFLSETKNIISCDQLNIDKINLWRKNHTHRNKILLKSISYKIATKTKVVDFPSPPQDFTGRKTELNELHEVCKNQNIVVITGLGGVGKTALALKYADKYKSYYKFIYFITASSQDSIVQGLIDLADKMNIPAGEISVRLKNLRNQLHEFEGDYLIIFDGIDHPEAFEELKTHLPNNRKCILLTSRMSEYAAKKLQCKSISLNPWSAEEAIDYLLTTTKSKECDQAKILVEKLGCLPLAINHASAYICTRNYTICKYIEQFDKYEVRLFKDKYLDLEKEEKTILTNWQITLDEIENFHKCSIAKPILFFFSFLSQAPIPLIVIEYWFETFFKNYSELEFGDGLRHLRNYSMIDTPFPGSYSVHLSVQNVTRYHLPSEEYYINLIQALNTLTYWMKNYDPENPSFWSFIRTIIPHCEMLSHYIQKFNDSRLDTEELYIFFRSLGIYFRQQGFFSKSLFYLQYCRKIAEKIYGVDHANMAEAIHNIGSTLREGGRLEDAETYFREALAVATKAYGTRDCPEVGKAIHSIGIVMQEKGKLNEAESYYREALEIKIKAYGTIDHVEVAKTINNIGLVLKLQGKLEESEFCFRETLKIETKAYGTIDHHEVASTLHNIGVVLKEKGNLDDAKNYLLKAFETKKKVYGTIYHPSVARTIAQNRHTTL